jgi:histidinol-phosphate aminotransferase
VSADRTAGGPPLSRLWDHLAPVRAYTVPPEAPPVKLDANELPHALPPEARRRLGEALAGIDLHRYPDARAQALRDALCARLGGTPGELVLGSGSDEVIALLMTALGRPPAGRARAAVLYPEPTFVMFGISARVHGLDPVGVPLGPRWELDVSAMSAAIAREQPNLIFLASPNNPTGNAFEASAIEQLVEAAPDSLVVLDEAYVAFADRSLRDLRHRHPNVAVLGTLSKIGFAAARIGWAQLHPDLAQEVDKARQPFNLNALSQAVGHLALTELWPVVQDHIRHVNRERDRLASALAAVPQLSVWPSNANFLLVKVREGDAGALAATLRGDGVAVRSFGDAAGPLAGHLRITVGTPEENDRLLDALLRRA